MHFVYALSVVWKKPRPEPRHETLICSSPTAEWMSLSS
jgi:hypothetical protein